MIIFGRNAPGRLGRYVGQLTLSGPLTHEFSKDAAVERGHSFGDSTVADRGRFPRVPILGLQLSALVGLVCLLDLALGRLGECLI
jgi:hypothetical protein